MKIKSQSTLVKSSLARVGGLSIDGLWLIVIKAVCHLSECEIICKDYFTSATYKTNYFYDNCHQDTIGFVPFCKLTRPVTASPLISISIETAGALILANGQDSPVVVIS